MAPSMQAAGGLDQPSFDVPRFLLAASIGPERPRLGAPPYQRIRPRSISPCSARSLRPSRRSPSTPSSNAGPSR